MRTLLICCLVVVCSASLSRGQAPPASGPAAPTTPPTAQQPGRTRFPRPEKQYEYGPDSARREGVPRGRVEEFVWNTSKVFPDTIRRCAVYIPAQYDGSKPAALMVFQDGVRHYLTDDKEFRVPIVFDNLIHAGEMPVTIGVFIEPGAHLAELPAARTQAVKTDNRSFEYDSLGPVYTNFLLNEILPHVEQAYKVKFTDDPDFRAICGMSSGGICAWTVAWERPDQFHKVVSHVGSFTDIRGGHVYPDLIRAADAKTIRVFLQDGDNDNRNRAPNRNWVAANHKMAAALEEMDYDYKYVLGEGPHSGNHGGAIFPETMRWLWRDFSK